MTIIREALLLHPPLLDINGAKTMKWLRLLDKIVPDIVVYHEIVPDYISLLLAGPTKSEQNEVVYFMLPWKKLKFLKENDKSNKIKPPKPHPNSIL